MPKSPVVVSAGAPPFSVASADSYHFVNSNGLPLDVDKEFNSNQVGSALTMAFGPDNGYVFCYSERGNANSAMLSMVFLSA